MPNTYSESGSQMIIDAIKSSSDRNQKQSQFEDSQKIEKQKIELQKQELQVKQQQQDTQQLLVTSGLVLGGTLVLVVTVYLFVRMLRGGGKKT